MTNLLFKNILESIKKIKVVVVGDIMLDHYIWGDVNRISPEAPVPIVAIDHHTHTAGGAANVALNLRALGIKTELCGRYGTDHYGRLLESTLKENGIELSPLFAGKNIPTITKSRVIARQQQLCRLDQESIPPLYELSERLIKLIERKIENANALIISDYAKGVLNTELVNRLINFAKEKNCFVSMDPKPRKSIDFRNMDLLTPNYKESLELAGIALEPHEDFPQDEVCEAIHKKHNPHNLVITMGAKGMLLCEKCNISQVLPTYAREVFDVSGAGDTVIATLTAALCAGFSLLESAQFANTAAGIVVGKLGTATASPSEILSYHC